MGCDIHPIVEVCRNDPNSEWPDWRAKLFPEFKRDYLIFGILAGVRSHWELAPPIAEPRGLPVLPGEKLDFHKWETKLSNAHGKSNYNRLRNSFRFEYGDRLSCDSRTTALWLDEHYDVHSVSYVTLKELLDYPWDTKVTVKAYEIGANGDRDTIKAEIDALNLATDEEKSAAWSERFDRWLDEGRKEVETTLREVVNYYSRWFFSKTIPEMQALHEDPNCVRLVFWFDN